jgi:hypothetical protein
VKKVPLALEGILLQTIANQIHMNMAMKTLSSMEILHAQLASAAAPTAMDSPINPCAYL